MSAPGSLPDLLRQQLPDTTRVVVLANGEPEAWPRAALQGLEVVWRAPLSPAEQLATLADEADLRLFETASMSAQRARAARLWRAAAAVAALTVLAWPALLAWQHSALESEERAQSTANEALFHATFPDVTRLVNPRVQADPTLLELVALQAHARQFSWQRCAAQHVALYLELLNASPT